MKTTASENQALAAEFEAANAHLEARTEAVLSGIIHDRALHARFLNTLSMLEHMGSHKIMATQQGPAIDQATLKHLAEEARHAFFFKRLAEREAGCKLAAADLLAPAPARRYFQRLEAEIVRSLPGHADRRAAYLIMSMVVEFRAVWAYRIYQAALLRAGHGISLRAVLAEEAGHLGEMADGLKHIGQFDPDHIRRLWRIEQGLYERLLSALEQTATVIAA